MITVDISGRAAAGAALMVLVMTLGAGQLVPAAEPAPASMQAIVVVDGKPQLQSVSRPVPGTGEVVVRVRAAGVNPADWKRAERQPATPATPGWDIAGVISAVGPGVSGWKPGDAVMGFFEGNGGYVQYAKISVDDIAKKPAKLSFEQAAGVPLVAVTAYKALVDVADVQKGQRVLIHGAAGGVGSAGVQIAAARGAYVIATASERNHAFLKSIGAQETIDYNTERFEDRVHNADVAFNTVDEDTARRSLATLKPGGIMVTVAGPVPTEQCAAAHVRCGAPSRMTGTTIGQVLAEVGRLADAGKFTINVDARFPMDRASEAWALSKAGHTRGKIVLNVP
jgi:NADPH:quinone reductase-like Zn-dependent oxidoreductase